MRIEDDGSVTYTIVMWGMFFVSILSITEYQSLLSDYGIFGIAFIFALFVATAYLFYLRFMYMAPLLKVEMKKLNEDIEAYKEVKRSGEFRNK